MLSLRILIDSMKKIPLLFVAMLFVVDSQSQIFEFAKTIVSGTAPSQSYGVVVDNSGNSYSVWSYNVSAGAVDMDPGAGTFMSAPITTSGTNSFILKLDVLGNFVWAKEIKGTLSASAGRACSIAIDTLENIYFIGNLKGTVDFDPGAATFTLSSVSVEDFFTCKFDSSGNFVWANRLATTTANTDSQIALDSAGNIIIAGRFQSSVDFDAGSGVSILTGSSGATFLLKLDQSGAFVWAKQSGGSSANVTISLAFDKNGNIYSAGAGDQLVKFSSFGDTIWCAPFMGYIYSLDVDSVGNVIAVGYYDTPVDFDPGSGISMHTPIAGRDIFIQKLSPMGALFWTKFIGGASSQIANSVVVDSYNNVFVTGVSSAPADFDPGVGVYTITGISSVYTFVLKINDMGNFNWAFQIGGGNPQATFINADDNNSIYLNGFFVYVAAGTDFDPSPSSFTLNGSSAGRGFFAKYSQNVCSNISIVIDSITNVECGQMGFGSAHTTGGLGGYNYQWNTTPVTNDSIVTFTSSGIYQLTVTDANSCVNMVNVVVNEPLFASGIDLKANLISTNYRTGLSSTISLDGFNDGCVPTSGTLQLILDTLVIYTTALPIPDMISGDTLTWNFSNLIYDSTHVIPQVIVQTPTWAAIGDTVCFNLIMNPIAGDADPTNNTRLFCFPVINSYDPNDKKVYPVGICTSGYINNGELLTYTVRFQNTGNAPALDVYVLDSLDADLDLNTVRVIGNSHTLITEVLPGNVLKFRFDNINLVDSTINEAESHGYVVFEVMPNASLTIGTTITNNVGIYFDFNVPVYTNTVLNTISDGILNTGTTSMANVITADLTGASYQWLDCDNGNVIIPGATNQSYTATAGGNYSVIVSDGCFADTSACVSVFVTGMSEDISGNQFSFFPNPSNNTITINTLQATQIKIVNMLGEVLIDSNVKDKSIVDISGLANGVYFIQTQEGRITKLIKQ